MMRFLSFTLGVACTVVLLSTTSCVRVYVPFEGNSPTAANQSSEEATSELISQRLRSETALIIDARSPTEFGEKHYPGSINIPHDEAAIDPALLGSNLDRPILVYCRSGKRSELLRTRLIALGYRNVINGGSLEELEKLKEVIGYSD